MKKALFLFSLTMNLLTSISSNALIFANTEAMEEAIGSSPKGQYRLMAVRNKPLIDKETSSTATFIEDEKQRRFGLACAHSVELSADDEALGLVYKTQVDTIGDSTFTSFCAAGIRKSQKAELYKKESSWQEQRRNDLAAFTVRKKDWENLKTCFQGKIFQGRLEEGKEYSAVIRSQGPAFDNQLTSYHHSIFQQANITLRYDNKGFFYRTLESRKFYLFFNNKNFRFDILPAVGNVSCTNGDSGSLVTTLEGELLAIASGISWREFYKNNKEIEDKIKHLKEKMVSIQNNNNTTQRLQDLVSEVEEEIAEPHSANSFKTPEGYYIYTFDLRSNFSPVTTTEYFTPLSLHVGFINKFLEENLWGTTIGHQVSERYILLKNKLRVFKPSNLRKIENSVPLAAHKVNNAHRDCEQALRSGSKQEDTNLILKNYKSLRSHYDEIETYVNQIKNLFEEKKDLLKWFKDHNNKIKNEESIFTVEEIANIMALEDLITKLPEEPAL